MSAFKLSVAGLVVIVPLCGTVEAAEPITFDNVVAPAPNQSNEPIAFAVMAPAECGQLE